MKKLYKSLVDIKKYQRKGIYHSELFLFWKLAKKLGVNRIVESGTYYGFTANRLAKLFPECRIITYEFRKKRWKIAWDSCRKCNKEIEVMLGKLDPKVLTKKTAVIIDGPKWEAAITLATEIVDKVAMVGIHDMENYIDVLKERFDEVTHSGNPDSDTKKLDKYLDKATIKRHSKGKYYGTVLACVRNK